LNLALETLEGLEKHDTDYDSVAYHYFFNGQMPTLEAQVASVADAIAYRSHDLEDGLSSEVMTEADFDSGKLELWQMIKERLGGVGGVARLPQLARHLIDIMVTDVLVETERRLISAKITSVADVRAYQGVLVGMSPDLQKADSELGVFLHRNFYEDYRVARMMAKGKGMISRMFETFRDNPALLPPDVIGRYREAEEKRIGEPLRVIADYLASLTDRQAIDEYRKLFDVSPR
jgi:dGTPase